MTRTPVARTTTPHRMKGEGTAGSPGSGKARGSGGLAGQGVAAWRLLLAPPPPAATAAPLSKGPEGEREEKLRYLKLGGEARCNPKNGEDPAGDVVPFSRSAILPLHAGGREGGGGGCC